VGPKKTICKQPPEVSLFTNYHISTLRSLGKVRGTSDWSERKKKEKSASFGKVESLCTTKLPTFEKYS